MDQFSQTISILVVEDEASTLEHICSILSVKYPHINIYKALDGKTGLELFRHHTPNIVISDLTMPGMNGLEMASEIHAMKPSTKFIILTGDIGKCIPDKSVRDSLKFDHCIGKPIFLEDLFEAIEKCITAIVQAV